MEYRTYSAITPSETTKLLPKSNKSNDIVCRKLLEQALDELIVEVVKASKKGISVTINGTNEHNWDFTQSLFFTSCVVTTIGYGQITPLSRSGKIFCILYAIVGIPLTLVLLSGLVERFLVPAMWILQWLNSKLQRFYQPFSIRLLHLIIIVTFLVILTIFLPAIIFYYLEEGWTYLDAIYYCFISLTTIGLGDYIPGYSNELRGLYLSLYKMVTTVYLFFGITFMMLTLAVFYDIPQLNLGLLFSLSRDVFPRTRN
ncbi:potassium channel subfamily K member 6-like isoform X2 [Rhynchophorus ferrugineus]|uniref:potassium channel subfamily K member 6-like isoform X2 n=1 Tax=Rhynchophorus ferrugineus TaxID=354439 RepID=UPI003FCE6A2F